MSCGLKIMVGLAVVVMCSLHDVVAVGDVPRPWLTVNRTATVAELICEPPSPQSSQWESVHELRVLKNIHVRQFNSNVTLAFVASTMKDPQREQDLPDISRVVFGGTWQYKSPSLTIVMPFTEKDTGRYFCTGEYNDRNGHLKMFSTQAYLVQDSSSTSQKGSGSFKAKLIASHEVHVTWHMPSSSKFRGASVSRIMVDANEKNEKAVAPQLPLFSTSGSEELLYTNNAEILLSNFRRPSDTGNYSVTVFVKIETCDPFCHYQYSCYVPSEDCIGDNARFCTCGHKGAYLAAESGSDVILSFFIVFCVLFCLLLIFVLVFRCLCKADKYHRTDCAKKLFKRTSSEPSKNGSHGQNNQSGSGSSDQTEEVKTYPRSHQGDREAADEQRNDKSTTHTPGGTAPEPGIVQHRAEEKSDDISLRQETSPNIPQNEDQSRTNNETSLETDSLLPGATKRSNTYSEETSNDNQSSSGACGGTPTRDKEGSSCQVEEDSTDIPVKPGNYERERNRSSPL